MFIGREPELQLLRRHLRDRSKAQLIVLYGRRRIGKSTLIQQAVKNEKKVLFFEGIERENTRTQIDQFLDDLSRQTGRVRLAAGNWREVFQGLDELIRSDRWVLVFDEFPWMGAGRSRIVADLKLYWDRWARNKNLCLFLCGSVASFMTRHVVHSKALHNRKTLEMCLQPLTPRDSGLFIRRRSIREKAQLYMTLGGIPKYLEQIDPRQSLNQNLNRLCFSASGFFVEEYETLFKEQFRSIKVYETIVESLSREPMGTSELARRTGLRRGGGLQDQINNLERSQFVRAYQPVKLGREHRLRTKMYKLVDPFLLFYFRYIRPNRYIIQRNKKGENLFGSIAGPTLQQYYGYAFERLCEDAMDELLDRLGLRLVDVKVMGPYFQQSRSRGQGLQIDWFIIRRDSVWSLLEFKYGTAAAGTEVIREVEGKINRIGVPSSVTVEPILVSAAGVTAAVKKSGYFNQILGLSDLVS